MDTAAGGLSEGTSAVAQVGAHIARQLYSQGVSALTNGAAAAKGAASDLGDGPFGRAFKALWRPTDRLGQSRLLTPRKTIIGSGLRQHCPTPPRPGRPCLLRTPRTSSCGARTKTCTKRRPRRQPRCCYRSRVCRVGSTAWRKPAKRSSTPLYATATQSRLWTSGLDTTRTPKSPHQKALKSRRALSVQRTSRFPSIKRLTFQKTENPRQRRPRVRTVRVHRRRHRARTPAPPMGLAPTVRVHRRRHRARTPAARRRLPRTVRLCRRRPRARMARVLRRPYRRRRR